MKKIILGALVVAAASLAFVGISTKTPTASADPASILLLRPITVNALAGHTLDLQDPTDLVALAAVATLLTPAELDARDGLADGVIHLVPADFAAVDVDANQLVVGDFTGGAWVLAFINNTLDVVFEADAGQFLDAVPPGPQYVCTPPGGAGLNPACLGSGPTAIEIAPPAPAVFSTAGIAVARLMADGAARGSYNVHVTQGVVTLSQGFTVTGAPSNLTLTTFPAAKNVIQTGGDASGDGNCQVSAFAGASGLPQYVGLVATLTDYWGTRVAGWPVNWLVSDRSMAQTASDLFPAPGNTTLTLQTALDIIAPNVLCGRSSTGTVQVTAQVVPSTGLFVNQSIGITVVGAPANIALAAAPSSLLCNGTNSSVVTATITDSHGNPVAEGNDVMFQAVALANANPILATTGAGGIATSTITPLAGVTSGVVVNVFVGSLAQSIRIDCQQPAPVPTAAPTGGEAGAGMTPTGITPPNTGTGGYSDGGSFSWLALAGLLGAGSVLFVGGLSLRRARR